MKMKNVICNCCLTSHYIFPCHEDVSSAKIRVSFFLLVLGNQNRIVHCNYGLVVQRPHKGIPF